MGYIDEKELKKGVLNSFWKAIDLGGTWDDGFEASLDFMDNQFDIYEDEYSEHNSEQEMTISRIMEVVPDYEEFKRLQGKEEDLELLLPENLRKARRI